MAQSISMNLSYGGCGFAPGHDDRDGWMHGYDVAFGIVDRDRKVRPSAEVLRREARSGSGAC